MIELNDDKILLLHQLIIEESGGEPNIRDINLLDSAINNAFQTFDGEYLYKTKEEKAAVLAYALISNHAFVDGNKRIGVLVMLTFLETNGVKIKYSNEDLIKIGIKVAQGKMSKDDILKFINEHKIYNL